MIDDEKSTFYAAFSGYFPRQQITPEQASVWNRYLDHISIECAMRAIETVYEGHKAGPVTLADFRAAIPPGNGPKEDTAAWAARMRTLREQDAEQDRILAGAGREEIESLAFDAGGRFATVYGWMRGFLSGKASPFGRYGTHLDPCKPSSKCNLIEKLIRDAAFCGATGVAPLVIK